MPYLPTNITAIVYYGYGRASRMPRTWTRRREHVAGRAVVDCSVLNLFDWRRSTWVPAFEG